MILISSTRTPDEDHKLKLLLSGLVTFVPLGPLTRAEAMKLAWGLPGLDRLSEPELDQVQGIRLVESFQPHGQFITPAAIGHHGRMRQVTGYQPSAEGA